MNRICRSGTLSRDCGPLLSLRDINRLPKEDKEAIYSGLLPEGVREVGGSRLDVSVVAPEGLGLVRLSAGPPDMAEDRIFFVELADTPYGQLELSFCLINDLRAPRFDVDRDARGIDNCFGTLRRNIPREVEAMRAGLSPHQVRKGLGLFPAFFSRLESFAAQLAIDTIVAEPLSYCNAVRYEQLGFDYIAGKRLMNWIDREFACGGILNARLDGSCPFRQPGLGEHPKGRSWAIHDGILGRPWDGVRIYKTIGRHAGIGTFTPRQAEISPTSTNPTV